jgi:DNA-binding LacI/PurR family transcriptional regulator
MPTIHDVAKAAGVSARTVSRVMNDAENVKDETRRKVLSLAEEMDYRPDPAARALKSGRKRVVGIVANAVSSDATQRRIEVVSKLFNAAGYAILVQYADTSEIEESAVQEIAPRCDGMIVFTNLHAERSAVFDSLEAASYPFILVDPPVSVSYPSIHLDRRSGFREAVKYLANKGRRRVLLLVEEFRSADRIAGFRAGSFEAGLLQADGEVDAAIEWTAKGFSGGRAAAPSVVRRFRSGTVDAVLCHNDKIALGLISALREERVAVPEDISVVGFDDDAYAAFVSPPLTTFAQSGGDLGAYIFEQLKNRIEYGTPVESRTFGAGLIQRASA